MKIRDHFVDGSDLVLVTESIDGTRLDHLLDDVSPVVAEYWANYLSESLQAIHSSGEIHGSLVPQAIYKTNDGMKIIGAGLSKVWGPVLGKMPAMCTMSTRSFLSPEVRLDGIDAATHSSDVYSLGAILYSGYTRYNSSDICVMPSSKVDDCTKTVNVR